jgi:release factor glutamine methyltransferase
MSRDGKARALVELGRYLVKSEYAFTTISPETHRRVRSRDASAVAQNLRDVFGWSKPFTESLLPAPILSLLETAQVLKSEGGLLRSSVRFSSLGGELYVHSAYPTVDGDSVFFGPDTYRFIRFMRGQLPAVRSARSRTVVDIGCGSGVGGIVAAQTLGATRTILADINPAALLYSQVNATLAKADTAEFVNSDVLSNVDATIDLIVSNPPYMSDPGERQYRHGGSHLGSELSVRIVRESLSALAPGGQLILYTGTAIVDGRDTFRAAVEPMLRSLDVRYEYSEIDPDVFGEELEQPAYANADRIAAVGLVVFVSNNQIQGRKFE